MHSSYAYFTWDTRDGGHQTRQQLTNTKQNFLWRSEMPPPPRQLLQLDGRWFDVSNQPSSSSSHGGDEFHLTLSSPFVADWRHMHEDWRQMHEDWCQMHEDTGEAYAW